MMSDRYTIRLKRYGLSRTVEVVGQTSYVLVAKWIPCLGFLGRKYLFSDTAGRCSLWLEQKPDLIKFHFTISEDGKVVGEAGTNALWTKGFVKVPDLGEFEIPFGHGFRTDFSTTTNSGEDIEISLSRITWKVLLPSRLNDYRVLAGLALSYAACMSRG